MKKYLICFIIILAIIICGLFIYFNGFNKNSNKDKVSYGEKTSTNVNIQSHNNLPNTSNLYGDDVFNNSQVKELSSYTTEIKDNSAGRLTNINLTCSSLNNTTISPGDIFSFNNVVRKIYC
ncbi:MAG: hypothetical protein GX682_01115 [Clostridiaceae bacterium]|nr:hypothetical protein [Clostridiaceae bacterium]